MAHRPMCYEDFEDWKHIGSGAFGAVYRARHKILRVRRAIKILNRDCSPSIDLEKSLSDEAEYMKLTSSEYVVMVFGLFEGTFQDSMAKGIVMEFMERGSVQTLIYHNVLPEWPLVFRMAHQVALGMNVLHENKPGLVHQDLKPSNVLLNAELNAKLADFGLCRVSASAVNNNEEEEERVVGGTYKYMPPEALLNASCKRHRSFDVYSYGIFLAAISTGQEPYPGAGRQLVKESVGKDNQRPSLEELENNNAKGLKELVTLMKKCWQREANDRPDFQGILDETEKALNKYREEEIRAAVENVLVSLSRKSHSSTSTRTSAPYSSPPQPRGEFFDTVDIGMESPSSEGMDIGPAETISDTDKATFIEDKSLHIIESVKNVTKILKELGDIVAPEIFTRIEAIQTRQDKIRDLYQTSLHSGGEYARARFYDALKIYEKDLMRNLGA